MIIADMVEVANVSLFSDSANTLEVAGIASVRVSWNEAESAVEENTMWLKFIGAYAQ